MASRRARPPLDQQRLSELALRYVGRFATTRARLRAYLERKIRERGWDGPRPPDVGAIADRFAELGYVDDAGYALAKSRALSGRGYGKRRVTEALRVAGIADEDGAAAQAHAESKRVAAALRFAEKRRIGPFAEPGSRDPRQHDKALAAMVRAGHPFDLALTILSLPPGEPFDLNEFSA
ncbi:MAG TPA: RecX family transcriptional regulator [Sphingomicrobium sp.]|nr:RecX family transcriptional regulator [Sphingomicrobium sp.]